MKKLNKAKAIKLIALIITIAILIIATIYMIPVIKQINTPEGQAEFKEKITNSAILPGEPVELLAGICFGPIWGTIFLIISVFIVTAMIYFFVKKYGRDFIYEFFPKEKVTKLENSKLFKDTQKIETVMALLFLIPGTPKDLLVYIGGLLPIKASRFLAIATLLRFPSIISSTIAGNKLLQGKWQVSILAYVITFVLTFIVIYIVNKFDKNKVTKDVINSVKNKEM